MTTTLACPHCNTSLIPLRNKTFRCRNPACKQVTSTPVQRASAHTGLQTLRRKPEEVFNSIPTIEQLDQLISSIPTERDQVLLRLLYTTGCRISEVLSLTAGQFNTYTDANGDRYLTIDKVPVLKKKKQTFRQIDLLQDKNSIAIFEYIQNFKPSELLFPISRQQAWQISKKLKWENHHLYNHILRSIRVSHLSQVGLDQKELMNEFKWTNSAIPLHYIFADKEKTKQKKKLAIITGSDNI